MTKVSPDGSAARSGGVEVGDQLACINGQSSLKMKVDDICDVIASSHDPSQVELIFLRYIGPFRPANRGSYRIDDIDGSFDDSVGNENPTAKGLWRKNPVKKNPNKKEETKVKQPKTNPPKKKGFRLFGRGKNKS